MFLLRIVPAVLMAAVIVLGVPVTNNGRALESTEGYGNQASLHGHEHRYSEHGHQEGHVSRYSRGGLGERNEVGHRAHAEAVEQIRREILYDYLYGRTLEKVKGGGQLASASDAHKADTKYDVKADHKDTPQGLQQVKFSAQLADANDAHKAHIESLVKTYHETLPDGHEYKSATQAVVFKDFHHSPGEDTSGPKHVTVRFYKGARSGKNELGTAAHLHEQ